MSILEINSIEEFELALKRENFKATLVYFTARWCLPSENIRYKNVFFINLIEELKNIFFLNQEAI